MTQPYIPVTDIITTIDSNIDSYVSDLAERGTLPQIPVNGVADNSARPKYVPGNVSSALKIPLLEQMVYHRAGSTNKNPLELFIPTQYKINYQKIADYFAKNAGNDETQALKTAVIDAYGKNYNSLFYKHTIRGKPATAASTSVGSGATTDLDKKTADTIQGKIDKWHKDYTEWIFYDSASTFFIQERELPRDELLTLKISVDDIFSTAGAGASASGVMKLVDEIATKYDELDKLYVRDGAEPMNFIKNIKHYQTFLQKVYEDIGLHFNDPIDVEERKIRNYKFDENIKKQLYDIYGQIKVITDGLPLDNLPYLQVNEIINTFLKTIDVENERFKALIGVTDAFERFDAAIGKNKKIGGGYENEPRKYYKTYKLIQYIYWLLAGKPSDKLDPFQNDTIVNQNKDELKALEKTRQRPDYENKITELANTDYVEKLINEYTNIQDNNMKEFIKNFMRFNIDIQSYFDINLEEHNYRDILSILDRNFKNKSSIDLPFGIDLLFYVLYDVTKEVIRQIRKQQIIFDKINEAKNPEIQKLRQEIQLKERKLKNICNLIAQKGRFQPSEIIPDSAEYYYRDTGGAGGADAHKVGLVNPVTYRAKWSTKLTSNKKIEFTISDMKKKLDQSLGLSGAVGAPTAKDQTILKESITKLIKYNTIQVVGMLFAKPRYIWYSPSMRLSIISPTSKWAFFQLAAPEIVSGRGMKEFIAKLNEPPAVAVPTDTPMDLILKKKPVGRISLAGGGAPLCVFNIDAEKGPQMLPKGPIGSAGGDATTDSRFQNPAFSDTTAAGAAAAAAGTAAADGTIPDGASFTEALTHQAKKIFPFQKPNAAKCATARGQLSDAFNEMSELAANSLKDIGLDIRMKMAPEAPVPPVVAPPIPPPLPPPPPSAAAQEAAQAAAQAAAARAAALARARAAARIIPPAPVPPLPPPPVPPLLLTHEQIVAAAWKEVTRTSGKLNRATITKTQAEPNREYAKKLCEYARVSVDHIYKVNAAIVKQDMDAIHAEMKKIDVSRYLPQGNTAGDVITHIETTITTITGQNTDNYCADFNVSTKSYTDILKSILGNIQKTVGVDKKCVDVIVNSVSVIREIIRPYEGSILNPNLNTLNVDIFPKIQKMKNTLNSDITALNDEINGLTKWSLGWVKDIQTDRDNLKRLSDNLYKINDKIVEMMGFYKQVVDIYKSLESTFLQIETAKAAAAAANAAKYANEAAGVAAAIAAKQKYASNQIITTASTNAAAAATAAAAAAAAAAAVGATLAQALQSKQAAEGALKKAVDESNKAQIARVAQKLDDKTKLIKDCFNICVRISGQLNITPLKELNNVKTLISSVNPNDNTNTQINDITKVINNNIKEYAKICEKLKKDSPFRKSITLNNITKKTNEALRDITTNVQYYWNILDNSLLMITQAVDFFVGQNNLDLTTLNKSVNTYRVIQTIINAVNLVHQDIQKKIQTLRLVMDNGKQTINDIKVGIDTDFDKEVKNSNKIVIRHDLNFIEDNVTSVLTLIQRLSESKKFYNALYSFNSIFDEMKTGLQSKPVSVDFLKNISELNDVIKTIDPNLKIDVSVLASSVAAGAAAAGAAAAGAAAAGAAAAAAAAASSATAAGAAGAAAASSAAAVAAVVASPFVLFGGLVTAAAKSIAGILGTGQPITLPQTGDIQTETNELIEPLLAEMEQKINKDVAENQRFTTQSKIKRDEFDKLKQAANAIQAPPPPPVPMSQQLSNDIQDLETLLQNVNEDIDKMNNISATLQTETTHLIKDIRQDIGNITSSTTPLNKGTFENIKNKSERLTQLYSELKAATEQLKNDIDKKKEQYNLGFDSTKQKVLAGIRQRLTAILSTLAKPTDPDGERLIQEIDTLLDSVEG